MHTIRYKNCVAQQDNKTFEVFVSKNGFPSIRYEYAEKLSGSQLRTVVGRYLSDINQ